MNDSRSDVEIPVIKQLRKIFGYLPSFHDTEVSQVVLNRTGVSSLIVMFNELGNDVDHQGHFAIRRSTAVTFLFTEIVDLELADFNSLNVISSLAFERRAEVVRLTIQPCYGIGGYLEAKEIAVEVSPVRHDS